MTDRASERRRMRPLGIIAVTSFALGVLASELLARWRSPEQTGEPAQAAATGPVNGDPRSAPTQSAAPAFVVKPPQILFDPDSISLLPDASLRLELPENPSAMPPQAEPPRSTPARPR